MNNDEDDYDLEQVMTFQKYSTAVTKEVRYMFIDYLIYKKADFVIAPYEADAQLAFMFKHGEIDLVITEDSDLIAYNCTQIIKKLKLNGTCMFLNLERKRVPGGNPSIKSFLGFGELTRPGEAHHGLYPLRLRLLR